MIKNIQNIGLAISLCSYSRQWILNQIDNIFANYLPNRFKTPSNINVNSVGSDISFFGDEISIKIKCFDVHIFARNVYPFSKQEKFSILTRACT